MGERVTVSLHGAKAAQVGAETPSTTTDALGHWSVYLAPQPAGGARYTLTVAGLTR